MISQNMAVKVSMPRVPTTHAISANTAKGASSMIKCVTRKTASDAKSKNFVARAVTPPANSKTMPMTIEEKMIYFSIYPGAFAPTGFLLSRRKPQTVFRFSRNFAAYATTRKNSLVFEEITN